MSSTTMIAARYIIPNKDNPRTEAGDVTDLIRSIDSEGLKDPLLVRPAEIDEVDLKLAGMQQFVIEDGFRRWTAMRMKHGPDVKIECRIVRPPKEENKARRALVTALITSVHKKQLNPMERALAYGRMRDELGMTVAQIARAVGLTTGAIYDSLTLLELAPKSRAAVVSGKLSVKDAQNAVRDTRKKQRKKEGKKPVEVGWEPENFTPNHILHSKAATMCETREHSNRRRRAGACDYCWETVIRQDQDKVTRAELIAAGAMIPKAVFTAPIMTPDDSAHQVNGATTPANG